MVRVCMLAKQGTLVGFEADGHADYAPEGSDIVCSAVSALTQTTLLGLLERLQLPVRYDIGEGTLTCILEEPLPAAQAAQASILLDTLLLGLQSMQGGYGEYLSITQREV